MACLQLWFLWKNTVKTQKFNDFKEACVKTAGDKKVSFTAASF